MNLKPNNDGWDKDDYLGNGPPPPLAGGRDSDNDNDDDNDDDSDDDSDDEIDDKIDNDYNDLNEWWKDGCGTALAISQRVSGQFYPCFL
jgi:hypothetical protein